MPFPMTLFNSITLLIMAAAVATGFARWRCRIDSNWFAAPYALFGGFWFGFDGSLNTWWMLAGACAAIVLRASPKRPPVRVAARLLELAFLVYVLWRGVGLLLLW